MTTDIDAMRALHKKAANVWANHEFGDGSEPWDASGDFDVAAAIHMPAILDELEAARAEIARLRSRVKLYRAKEMCELWHKGQVRKYTGEPYHVHPCEVAGILMGIGASDNVIVAGYLHDVIEDCGVTASDISKLFGERVAELVVMVTDVSRPGEGNRAARKAMDRYHIAKADADGQTVKLADIISNTRSIVQHDPDFAKIYLAEKADLLAVMTKGNEDLRSQAANNIWYPKAKMKTQPPR